MAVPTGYVKWRQRDNNQNSNGIRRSKRVPELRQVDPPGEPRRSVMIHQPDQDTPCGDRSLGSVSGPVVAGLEVEPVKEAMDYRSEKDARHD